jgi:sec-independent protein translocase protein TatB
MVYHNLAFLDISGGEFLIIIIAAFFIFGPKRLPEIARKIGRTMNEIKSASNEITKEFTNETKAITSEIRAARESIRIESIMDANTKPIKNAPSTPPNDNSISLNNENITKENKLTPLDCVTYENDNKIDINDVKEKSSRIN